MKRILIVCLLAASPPALAQQQQITLSVTTQEAQYLLNALSAQPWKDVNPLMQKLVGQVNAQMMPKAALPPPHPRTEPPLPKKNGGAAEPDK